MTDTKREPEPIPWRSLQALIVHACNSDPALVEPCIQIGVDPARPRRTYSLKTWRQVIALVRRHRFGHLSEFEGTRAVGFIYLQGFTRTLVGRVFAAIAKSVGPEKTLARIPRYLRSGRQDLKMEVEALAPFDWRALVEDAEPQPAFVMGSFEGVLAVSGAKDWNVTLVSESPGRYELNLRWSPPSA